jgi:hypothetical protein
MKNTNQDKSTLEQFDNNVYARTSVNNMPRITALVSHTEEEQKEIDNIFETAI